jgi:hypothetical protein
MKRCKKIGMNVGFQLRVVLASKNNVLWGEEDYGGVETCWTSVLTRKFRCMIKPFSFFDEGADLEWDFINGKTDLRR